MHSQCELGALAESTTNVCWSQLRLNKVSELIHNSTHHQDVPMARVSVHFVEIIDKVLHFRLAFGVMSWNPLTAVSGRALHGCPL